MLHQLIANLHAAIFTITKPKLVYILSRFILILQNISPPLPLLLTISAAHYPAQRISLQWLKATLLLFSAVFGLHIPLFSRFIP